MWVMLVDYCLTLAALAPSLVALGPRAAWELCAGTGTPSDGALTPSLPGPRQHGTPVPARGIMSR